MIENIDGVGSIDYLILVVLHDDNNIVVMLILLMVLTPVLLSFSYWKLFLNTG